MLYLPTPRQAPTTSAAGYDLTCLEKCAACCGPRSGELGRDCQSLSDPLTVTPCCFSGWVAVMLPRATWRVSNVTTELRGAIVRGMGVVDRAEKQRGWGDVNEREHKISKTRFKRGHLQHLHASKKVPTRHCYGEIPQTLSGQSACWAAALTCLYANARSMGNKGKELEICVQSHDCGLVGIMEMRWDSLHDWSVAMEGHRLFRKDRPGRQGGGVVLHVRQQLECLELCLGMGEQPAESLWVGIKEQTSMGDIVVGVHYRLPDREEQADEAAYGQLEAASHSQTAVVMGDFNHLNIRW